MVDYTLYGLDLGLDSQVFMTLTADGHLLGTAFQWTTNDHNLI